jgi:hypothetical protein
MKEVRLNNAIGLLFSILVFICCAFECKNANNPPPSNNPTSTPIPEKRIEMSIGEIAKSKVDIEKNVLANYFLRCDESEKERWFALYENDGETYLFEFFHKTIYKDNKVGGILWRFVPEGILQKDKIGNEVVSQGNIEFVLFDDLDDSKKNFLYKYNKEKSLWEDSENFDSVTLSKYKLPLKIHTRKKRSNWEFELETNVWTTKFPFKKPKIHCVALKSKSSLREFNVRLFGVEKTPTPQSNVLNGTFCSKNEEGYLNEGGKLRSSPKIDSNNEIEIWHKDSKLEIIAIVEGDIGKTSSSKLWYKVIMISGDCDNSPYCKKEGYIHSSVVTCSPN